MTAHATQLDGWGIIIQARLSSQRFPGKMLRQLGGTPLAEFVYERCRLAGLATVAIATSDRASDDALASHCRSRGIPVIRGPLDDVLGRYIDAAHRLKLSRVVRVCGDTPLVDIARLKTIAQTLSDTGFDYVSFDRSRCLSAFYSEAVTVETLQRARSETEDPACLEHVTKHLLDHPERFSVKLLDPGLLPEHARDVRLTVDFPEDLARVESIVARLPDPLRFSSEDVLSLLRAGGKA